MSRQAGMASQLGSFGNPDPERAEGPGDEVTGSWPSWFLSQTPSQGVVDLDPDDQGSSPPVRHRPVTVTVTPDAKVIQWRSNMLTPQAQPPRRHLTCRSRAIPLLGAGSAALFGSRSVTFATTTGLASANVPEVTGPMLDPDVSEAVQTRLQDSLDTDDREWVTRLHSVEGPSLKRRRQLAKKMCEDA